MSPAVAASPASAETPVGALPTTEDFVTQQYEDFLSRPPDAAGLAYWTALVEGGLDPSALVESLAQSPEFEGTMAPVVRLYYAHFQRSPDYDGMTYWAQVARSGSSMNQISEQFVLSNEFQVRYGTLTNEQYVNQVYTNVLGRSADAGGLAHWTSRLAQGMSRGELMVSFSDSAEYRELIGGRVLATMLYVGMLRRAPETSGLDYWAQVVQDGTPYRNVIAGFLGAPEYGGRIDQIYNKVNPLTGVPTRVFPLRPALAVKIDNVDAARPPTNLERADLVYEEMVEGQLTRLVAVFHSKIPDVVGPVRSVRTTDIDLLDQFNTPLLAASGANSGVLAAVAAADLVNVNALVAGGAYFRDNRRSAPHNMYTRPVQLYAAGDGQGGGKPPQIFQYRTPGTGPTGGVASSGVSINFGSANIDFTWSEQERGWRRSQNGSAHVTASGKQLAPANVVVLEVPYGVSHIDANSPEALTVGSGTAHIFTGGQRITATWSRSQSSDVIKIKDGNSNEIPLTRGQTFIELAPPGSIQVR
ncbi:MAG: DUF4214 domain-containing protein [Actinomycetia bacterium]|nr:DUF4214 domain-containing protein [Actinomycetes bacterium]MCP4222005.1 DUF4214 domain-containing protein [Actinomycetes bacterium]